MTYLHGIRVIDFTQLLPGPFCTMLLSDLGADVIKVEPPGSGDAARTLLPGVFWAANRGKRSISINLKTRQGKEIGRRLLREADVLVEGFRPGVMERLGLDYDTVKQLNPRIVYCSISGFGQSGPNRDRPGHDLNYLAVSGALDIPGDMDYPPVRPGLPVGDLTASMFAALTIVAALHRSRAEGKGDYLDVSIADCLLSWVSTRIGNHLKANLQQDIPFEHLSPTNKPFETKDGQWITVGIVEEKFWVTFCNVVGRTSWLNDARFGTPEMRRKHGAELNALLKSLFKQKELAEWEELFRNTDIPYAKVNRVTDLGSDSQIVERGLVVNVDGQGSQVRYPVLVASRSVRSPGLPPVLGEHTDAVLSEIGYTRDQISHFRKEGIIF